MQDSAPDRRDRPSTAAWAQTRPALRDADTHWAHMQRILIGRADADRTVLPVPGLEGCTTSKACLFGDESEARAAGDERVIVDLGGVQTGPMICFHIEWPEGARACRGGRRTSGPAPCDHAALRPGRAIENDRPLVYVEPIGRGEAFDVTGGRPGCLARRRTVGRRRPARSSNRPGYLALNTTPTPPALAAPVFYTSEKEAK